MILTKSIWILQFSETLSIYRYITTFIFFRRLFIYFFYLPYASAKTRMRVATTADIWLLCTTVTCTCMFSRAFYQSFFHVFMHAFTRTSLADFRCSPWIAPRMIAKMEVLVIFRHLMCFNVCWYLWQTFMYTYIKILK